jgi:glycerol-3-phosphate cytidylyltransferase-like family protein
MVNEEKERSKILVEALEYVYDACHQKEQEIIEEALRKYRGEA